MEDRRGGDLNDQIRERLARLRRGQLGLGESGLPTDVVETFEDRGHVSGLHTTIVHLMGLDHQRPTYFHQGFDQRLPGVQERHVMERVLP